LAMHCLQEHDRTCTHMTCGSQYSMCSELIYNMLHISHSSAARDTHQFDNHEITEISINYFNCAACAVVPGICIQYVLHSMSQHCTRYNCPAIHTAVLQ